MYVIVDTEHSAKLVEMTHKEYHQACDDADKNVFFTKTLFSRVTAQTAHKWVKEGGQHETPLYTNSYNQIRRARCPEKGGY